MSTPRELPGLAIVPYAVGMCCASACAPKSASPAQVAAAVNFVRPTGIESRWVISEDLTFEGGEPAPCPCNTDPERQHWLLEC